MVNNNEIVSKILAMNGDQLTSFLSTLKPSTMAYLDVILEKAEKNIPKLKDYLDKKK